MNWKLIFQLSLFGLAMGIGTVYLVSSSVEPWLWLAIFMVCAYILARRLDSRYFTHGLMIGIVNSFWVTSSHLLLFDSYIANHPGDAAMMESMPLPPRIMMACTGPVIGLLSGIVLGLFALVAAKIVKK